MTPLSQSIRRQLVDVVGKGHVLDDPELTRGYRVDWSGRFAGPETTVVRPGSTLEVAAVVSLCSKHGVAIVPQGGNTGLVGGGVPLAGELVLSTRRLEQIEEVDETSGSVLAGAGTSIGAIQAAAAAAGWAYGVDLASRDSASLGGTIATNAGGLRVLRNGDTRAQVLGIEAVTGGGAVIESLSAASRNNTGYHIPGLLCGSEGTLAVVTRARVRLVSRQERRATVLLRFDPPGGAADAAGLVRQRLPIAEAAEYFEEAGLRLVCSVHHTSLPFAVTAGSYVLLEAASVEDPLNALQEFVEGLSGVADIAVATDRARRASLWRYRELHSEAINTLGQPHKLDVAVPLPELPTFLDSVEDAVQSVAEDARVWLFGHIAEGSVHVNVTGVPHDDYSTDDAVFTLVHDLGGTISAEHGIGTAKRRWLHLSRSEPELALFRDMKRTFDPTGILNPNVLLPALVTS